MKADPHSFGIRRKLVRFVVVTASMLITSCAVMDLVSFGQKPPEVTGAVIATDTLNPRGDGLSTSVVLRMYQLKAPSAFTKEDFFMLYENGEATLGSDSLVKEFVVFPNSITLLDKIKLSDGNAYVGVLAAFRDWKNAGWRAVFEAPPNRTTILNIQLDQSDISLTEGNGDWLQQTRKDAGK